jgi:hypothetical protein
VLRLAGGALETPHLMKAGAGGELDFTGGVLQASRVGFDLVDRGIAHLGGALEIHAAAGFALRAGDQWTILTAARGISGSFTSVTPGYAIKRRSRKACPLPNPPPRTGEGIGQTRERALYMRSRMM